MQLLTEVAIRVDNINSRGPKSSTILDLFRENRQRNRIGIHCQLTQIWLRGLAIIG